MKFISLFKTSFLSTFLRFDLAVICCAGFTAYFLFPEINVLKFHNSSLILCCGAIWLTASKLFSESLSLPRWGAYALSLPIFGGLAYYFYCLPMLPSSTSWPVCLILLGLMLLIFIAPFIARRSDSEDIWSFQFDILKNGMVAGIASLILILGVCLVLVALDYLFSIKFYSSIYNDIFIVITCFIFPVMVLSGIPTNFEDTTLPPSGSILLKLLTYILIPLLIVYGIILHAYSLKIMITQTLPRGKVASLVAGFEAFILIIYTLTQRWKTNHQPLNLFHRYVGWFMITPLILMAWGICERVSVFGLTEARYFIALLWVWFVVSTVIILIRVSKPALWIVGSLSGLLLMCSMGPWGIIELPIKQQVHRLKTVLMHLRSAEKSTPTKEQKIGVSTILDYLSTRNRLADVQHLYLNLNTLLSHENLTTKSVSIELGVPYIEYSERAHQQTNYTLHYKTDVTSLPLQGYTHLVPTLTLSTHNSLSHSFVIKGVGSFNVKYSPGTQLFEITQTGVKAPVYQVNMVDIIGKLAGGSKNILHFNPVALTQIKQGFNIQVMFTAISADADADADAHNSLAIHSISEMSFIILVKPTPKK
jgi:hypothetical protein